MMISRKNFVMLTVILFVVLFLFQTTGVVKNRLNDADTNTYAEEYQTRLEESDAFSTEAAMDRLVLFLGDAKKSTVAGTIRQWCTYSKRGLVSVSEASECEAYLERAEILLVDAKSIDLEHEVTALQGYVDQGMSLVFCNLPDVEAVGANVQLEQLLGIRGIYDPQVRLTGVQLFDGFLLGGGATYQAKEPEEQKLQDMELNVPWYLTLEGNKTYMIGLVDDLRSQKGEIDNEYAPGLIWCYSGSGNGRVFVVNGDFMEDATGIGLLQAMMSELHAYELYPVVNAQNLSVVNYPSFANENSEEIEEIYSRELPSLYRDVIWQGISSVTERSRNLTTAFLAPQYDYEDQNEPSADACTYYARLFREKGMETGLSLEQVSKVVMEEKIRQDLSFLNENLAGYVYRAVYISDPGEQSLDVLRTQTGLTTVTTVLADYEREQPLFSYDGGLLIQRGTNDAVRHTYRDNFRLRAVESALGYSSIILDMEPIAYPQTAEDRWEKMSEKFAANLLTYWKPYGTFDQTTLSVSDVRVRRFLAMDYTQSRQGDVITAEIANFEKEAFFILRTHGEKVVSVENGTFVQLEKNVWLIGAEAKKIAITLENEHEIKYYY